MGILYGISMNVRGSLEPVAALIALRYGLIGIDLYNAIITVTVATSALIPPMLKVLTAFPRPRYS